MINLPVVLVLVLAVIIGALWGALLCLAIVELQETKRQQRERDLDLRLFRAALEARERTLT